MNLSKKTLLTAASAVVLLATGCEKNLLEQNNPNLATTATFWKSSDDAVRASNACYAGLQAVGTYRRWFSFLYDGRDDTGWSQSPYTPLQEVTKFVQTDYNFEVSYSAYRDSYRTIDRCNQVLANVPGIEMEAVLRTRIISEAYFLRALSYFNLVSLFGNVPLSTQPGSLEYRPAQGTEAQVWALVISDLQAAIGTGSTPNLPVSYASSTDRGRATVGAARTLLGKAYMQNKRWADAQAQFALVIGSNRYSLGNYTDNFRHTTENNGESVFEVQFLDVNIGGPDGQGGVDANTAQGFQRPKFFGPPQNAGTANLGFTDCEVRPWVVNEFLQEGTTTGQRDPRLAATVFYNYRTFASALPLSGDTLVYDQSRPANIAAGTYGFRTRYRGDNFNLGRTYWHKYQSDYYKGDENFDSPINFRVMRYADVLLLQAEALNEQSQTAAAVPLVNQVRRRAGLSDLPTAASASPAAMRTQIRHERVTELTGEGLRWFDLQRYGLLDTQAGIDQLKQRDAQFNTFVLGKSRLLPLPQQDVDLAKLQQNPQY